jgi:hypothetical protein
LLKVVCPAGRITTPAKKQVGCDATNVVVVLNHISTVAPDPKVPPLNMVVTVFGVPGVSGTGAAGLSTTAAVAALPVNSTGFEVMVPDAAFAGIGVTNISTDDSSRMIASGNIYLALLDFCIFLHLEIFQSFLFFVYTHNARHLGFFS